MEWWYDNKPFTEAPEGYEGFVYIIGNNETNKRYIGQKRFLSKRTRIIKGKKKRSFVESDWKTYNGSSQALLDDIAKMVDPETNLIRTILHLCKTKGEMNFIELEEQIKFRVLRQPNYFYNNFIGGKIHGKHIKHLQESS